FQSMREVIHRRFRNASEGNARFARLPNLVVIDGGSGQVKGAVEAMSEFGIVPVNLPDTSIPPQDLSSSVGCVDPLPVTSDAEAIHHGGEEGSAPNDSEKETQPQPVKRPQSLSEARIAVIGLEKREELIVLPGQKDRIVLPANSRALHVLQNIRDEAHRFARKYHVKLRTDRAVVSLLDSVPGIGKKRRTELIKHFGSFEKIQAATEAELAAAPGMNRAVARSVWGHLHPDTD
ncbi:MAG: helix-hairpin-helix domain-containing protein, partial [Armatimonadota bacterium]|nr:helix-hairpin-helix domain-containing protein [Armatimonadota bacterium]